MKWGDKYDSVYVNRLYHALKKNLSCPFSLYCYTDNLDGINDDVYAIKCVLSVGEDEVFTAQKIDLFSSISGSGRNVILDLDVLILNDVTELFTQEIDKPMINFNAWQDPRAVKANYSHITTFLNSSMVIYDDDQLAPIFDQYHDDKKLAGIQYKSLDKYLMYRHLNRFDPLPDKTMYSYSGGASWPDDLARGKYRPDYKVCIFNSSHGKGEELHNVGGWAEELWKSYDE